MDSDRKGAAASGPFSGLPRVLAYTPFSRSCQNQGAVAGAKLVGRSHLSFPVTCSPRLKGTCLAHRFPGELEQQTLSYRSGIETEQIWWLSAGTWLDVPCQHSTVSVRGNCPLRPRQLQVAGVCARVGPSIFGRCPGWLFSGDPKFQQKRGFSPFDPPLSIGAV